MSLSYLVTLFSVMASPSMSESQVSNVDETVEGDPVVMSVDEAPKYKTIDDKTHPDFVRCRRLPVPGMRLKTQRICMKNREWREYLAQKNRRTRGIADGQGSTTGFDQSKRLFTGSSRD